MLDRFREFINEHSLCRKGDRILVAVSGGIDSVVMMDLFAEAGFDTGMAHCNFQLRGEESEADAAFVESLAKTYSAEFHRKDFQTEQVADEEKISIQMAARNLRYEWFGEICKAHHYDLVSTAHNQDDVLETFFINLSRGTGIRGLTGIPVKSGYVIRPLLFASREEIAAYAESKGIPYREDSSNVSDKYLRNRVRHRLIPMLEKQNPSFRSSLIDTILKLTDTERIFRDEIDRLKKKLMVHKEDRILIRIDDLEKLESRKTVLYEVLMDFNFGSSSIEDIIRALEGHPGKQFYSPTHRLVRDRETLILTPLKEDENRKYYLELEEGQIFDPIDLEWVVVENNSKFTIPRDPNVACLDMDLLKLPLILRHWQKGDYFQPFGMLDLKKMSDFLIDEKVSLPDKEKLWLLTSGQKIVWVVGYRIDERFKITSRTRQVLMLKFSPAGDSQNRQLDNQDIS